MKTILIAAIVAIVMGTGSATATGLITGKQVKDGTITAPDLDPALADEINADPLYPRVKIEVPANQDVPVTVNCPDGTRAVNGGARSVSDGGAYSVDASYPKAGGWFLTVASASDADTIVTVFAVCV